MRRISLVFGLTCLLLGSASLMAQMTSYETYLEQTFAPGANKEASIVDSWSAVKEMDGYSVNVKFVQYDDGKKEISFPEKISKGLDYMLVNSCYYNQIYKIVICHYEQYVYQTSIIESEPAYFDVMFFREVSKDIYDKVGAGYFSVKQGV